MRTSFRAIGTGLFSISSLFCADAVADALPNPVRTCQDVRAYISADNSMTMETFKQLMTAAGNDLSGSGGIALDNQCKLTAYVKHLVMLQHILKNSDGSAIAVSTEVTSKDGVCTLTNVALQGC